MPKFDESSSWNKVQQKYNERDFDAVEVELIKLAEKSDNPSWYRFLLGSVQQERGKNDIALENIEKAIEINGNWSNPHALKAQLLQQTANGSLSNLYIAQLEIETAIRMFSIENTPDSPIEDPGALQGWLNNYINTSAGLYSQKNTIENEIKSLETLNRINDLDNKIERERMRNVEVIGVFSAIVALLLATAQGAINLKGPDFLWLGLGLVVPIAFLVLLITPRADIKGKALIQLSIFIVGCIAVGFFIDRWFF